MNQETVKSLVYQFIEESERIAAIEREFSRVMTSVCEDNNIVSLVPSSYYMLMDKLMRNIIGEEKFEWVCWWIYDSVDFRGVRDGTARLADGSNVELNTIDEFYQHVFEGGVSNG